MENMLSNKELREFIRGPLGQLIDNVGGNKGKKWEVEFKRFLRKEPCWSDNLIRIATKPYYLCDYYSNGIIELGPDNGIKMLFNAKSIFTVISRNFVNWGLNKKRFKKDKISIRNCCMIADGTMLQVLGSLINVSPDELQNHGEFIKKYRLDLRKFCVGQGQICELMKHRNEIMMHGSSTLILIENEARGEFFVVDINIVSGGGLALGVGRLEEGECNSRRTNVMVPKTD